MIRNEYVTNVPVRVLGETGPERVQITGLLRTVGLIDRVVVGPLLPGTLVRFGEGTTSRGVEGVSPNLRWWCRGRHHRARAVRGHAARILARPQLKPGRRPRHPELGPLRFRPGRFRSITDSTREWISEHAARVSRAATQPGRRPSGTDIESVKATPMVNYISGLVFVVLLLLGIVLGRRSVRPAPSRLSIFGLAWLFLDVVVSSSIRLAAQWQKAVVFRLGKFHSIKGPGLFMIIPLDRPAADG